MRALNVTPHIAQNISGQRSAVDQRTTRHLACAVSHQKRKRFEKQFGWARRSAGLRGPCYIRRMKMPRRVGTWEGNGPAGVQATDHRERTTNPNRTRNSVLSFSSLPADMNAKWPPRLAVISQRFVRDCHWRGRLCADVLAAGRKHRAAPREVRHAGRSVAIILAAGRAARRFRGRSMSRARRVPRAP
jgi:hypothetical protein